MLARRIFPVSAVALLMFVFAGTAAAGPYSMTGSWYENRGPLVDIPINGGPVPCGAANLACIGGLIPQNGGIPGSGTVMQQGVAPKTLTIPPSVFGQALPKQSVAVAIVPTVIQLATTFSLMGPAPARVNAPALPNTRRMRAQTFPTPDGRLQANFGWCFMFGGNPNCTNPASGVYNGLIKYTAGPNAYGGTMTMLLAGTGTVSLAGAGGAVINQPLAGGGSQAPGRGYADPDTDALLPGTTHASFMQAIPTCTMPLPPMPPGCELITAVSGATSMGNPDTNLNFGFPWTTGMVTAQNVETNQGQAGTSTLTGAGSDSRNGLGIGNITLVAGGTSHRFSTILMNPQNFANLDVIQMTISGGVPAMSSRGIAAGAVLLIVAAGYALRRRF